MKNEQSSRQPPLMRAATAAACPGWTAIGTLPKVPPPAPISQPDSQPDSQPAAPPLVDPVVGRG
ncbi:MAG: hypothetical protein CVU18_00785 [Betaproteobacteria bacterium HGW-Betaproteobacteria-12]|nr:MAG: hypothetical protein CVU18_00785 [Betaproteobacteria bacterium HGW-Betaproteobacteria-12]